MSEKVLSFLFLGNVFMYALFERLNDEGKGWETRDQSLVSRSDLRAQTWIKWTKLWLWNVYKSRVGADIMCAFDNSI